MYLHSFFMKSQGGGWWTPSQGWKLKSILLNMTVSADQRQWRFVIMPSASQSFYLKPSVVLEKGPGPGPALCGKLRCFVLRACAPSSMKDKPDSAALCPDKVKKIKTHEKNWWVVHFGHFWWISMLFYCCG